MAEAVDRGSDTSEETERMTTRSNIDGTTVKLNPSQTADAPAPSTGLSKAHSPRRPDPPVTKEEFGSHQPGVTEVVTSGSDEVYSAVSGSTYTV